MLDDTNLAGVVLFSTCEPCPMCSSLAVWSNVSTMVGGASIEQTAAKGKPRILVLAREDCMPNYISVSKHNEL